ncbi:hypothetical protein M5K25_006160 [Dendrobium thyrsiflorum]|uniref:Uncharacterized protein n=1 Tax=Dendrobium thyrsiflorum TaxID=117978 RepID=A0ABD0VHP2_DENTH
MCSAVLDGRSGLTEAVSPSTLNEERALVMYKPPDAHFASSLKINPKLITCLKNYTFWPRNPNMLVEEDLQSPTNNCLAVVPWVPSHVSVARQVMEALASGNELIEEQMEAEAEAEAAHTFMEIEEENRESDISGVGAQGNQQWQQHCMTPQLLQNNSTIMWS